MPRRDPSVIGGMRFAARRMDGLGDPPHQTVPVASRLWIALSRRCPYALGKSSGIPTTTNHGTSSLFAALDVKAGTIIGKCMSRHRAQEYRRFPDTVEQNVPAGLDIHHGQRVEP